MNMRMAAKTDIGRVRAQNEDNYLVALPLVAVADGMGGHRAGEVASRLALETLEAWAGRGASSDGLRDAVLEANRTVWAQGRDDQTLEGMGTTLTAAWVDGETVTLAHVGDSRAYLLRGGALSQLTEDQTLVRQWENEGKIEAGEAARHPYRSVLLQALGVDADVEPEILSVQMEPGDRLLLSTDGLHGPVSDERIREILVETADPEAACGKLIAEANENGGDDNITVVLIEAQSEGDATERAAPAPVIVSKPSAGHLPSRSSRRLRRPLLLVGVSVVALAAIVGVAFAMMRGGEGYVVAERSGRVAILRGSAGDPGEPARGKVVETTGISVESIPPTYQRSLESGIPADSLDEARRTVRSLPRMLGPADTPTPAPVPTTVPDASTYQ